MKESTHVKLFVDGTGRGKLMVDGVEVPRVRGCRIEARVSNPTIVVVELIGVEVEVDAQADIVRTLKEGGADGG
jgi:hypothetical protein